MNNVMVHSFKSCINLETFSTLTYFFSLFLSLILTQEGMAAQKAQDQESPLGQAYQKYMDALTLDEPKAIYNFHVGRMLVIQGNFDEAVKRLEVTLNWNPKHQFSRLEFKKLKNILSFM